MATKKRPLIETFLNPYKIIGENMGVMIDHFKESLKTNDDNFDKKISGIFDKGYRDIISGIYESLRDNGFFITGIERNKLRFSQIVSNDGIMYDTNFNIPGQPIPTKEEIKQMRLECRRNLNLIKPVDKPTPEDFDLSDVPC